MRQSISRSSVSGAFLATVVLGFLAVVQTWGCYFPNPTAIKQPEDVRRIETGISTLNDVLRLLGRPQVVETPELFVYSWEKSSGYLVVAAGYSGFGGPIGLKGTRAVFRFDAEGRVARIEASEDKIGNDAPQVSCSALAKPCGRASLGWLGPLASDFAPDGAGLAIIHASHKTGSCVLVPSTGRILASFNYHPKVCAGVGFSASGNRVAAIGACEPLVVWSLPDGAEIGRFGSMDEESLEVCRKSVALSPDGNRLVSHGPDGAGLAIWDVDTGVLRWKRSMDGVYSHSPTFSPDGTLVVAGIGSGLILLDAATGRTLLERSPAPEAEWTSVPRFSPDGRYLIVASCVHLEVWEVSRLLSSNWSGGPAGVQLLPFPRYSGVPCKLDLAFAQDGSGFTLISREAVSVAELPSGTIRNVARLPVSAIPLALDPAATRLALVLSDKVRICDIPAPDQRE